MATIRHIHPERLLVAAFLAEASVVAGDGITGGLVAEKRQRAVTVEAAPA